MPTKLIFGTNVRSHKDEDIRVQVDDDWGIGFTYWELFFWMMFVFMLGVFFSGRVISLMSVLSGYAVTYR